MAKQITTSNTGLENLPSLGQLELQFRLLLCNCNLIGELDFTETDLGTITGALENMHEHGFSLKEICERYQATIAVFLTFTGVFRYSARGMWEYWAGVWEVSVRKRPPC